MKATLIPQSTPQITHAIVVGGQQVGDVRSHAPGRYHAVLQIQPTRGCLPTGGLAQGHGAAPEAAIAAAFDEAQREAQDFLLALAQLREQVLG